MTCFRNIRLTLKSAVLALLVGVSCSIGGSGPKEYSVLVYGATPGGIAAAVAASRMGKHVCLVAEGEQVGGMMASGLGITDAGNPDYIGGISAEVFRKIAARYRDTYGEDSEQYRACAQGFHFEPHVAGAVFEQLLEDAGVDVIRGWRLDEVEANLSQISAVSLVNNSGVERRRVAAFFFIDASYTGDLYAEAGSPFVVGREARADYGESMAGQIYQDYRTREPLPGGSGEADSLVQAYNYRLCLTDSLENSVPWPEPEHYDPEKYKILYEYIEHRKSDPRDGKKLSPLDFLNIGPLPNRKFDINNYGHCWLSTDLVGGSQGYPQGTWEERLEIEKAHREHILGLFKFLRTDPGVPEELRREFGRFAPAADEFTATGNWPFQIYVREARRLHGEIIFTQHDATVDTLKPESVGMGSYNLDSHATGPLRRDYRWREGFFILSARPYQIPYRVMVPTWLRNLLVPVAVSSTHVGYGTLRMEPVWMILGHAAGVASALCVEINCEAHECPVPILQRRLREQGQIVSHDEARSWEIGTAE